MDKDKVLWWQLYPCIKTHIDGILLKGPYLPCVSMAGRALLAGYPRYISGLVWDTTNYNALGIFLIHPVHLFIFPSAHGILGVKIITFDLIGFELFLRLCIIWLDHGSHWIEASIFFNFVLRALKFGTFTVKKVVILFSNKHKISSFTE